MPLLSQYAIQPCLRPFPIALDPNGSNLQNLGSFRNAQPAEVAQFDNACLASIDLSKRLKGVLKASTSIPRDFAPMRMSSSGTRSAWPPRLVEARARAWSTRIRRMICEQMARK